MKKLKLIAGIFWAFLCMIIIIIFFPGMNIISEKVSHLPFMKINPRYTGGEVARQLEGNGYTYDIRKPVFDGVFKERKSGFVQIDWRGTLPEIINDTIDYDNDGRKDFHILIDSKKDSTVMVPENLMVRKVLVSTQTSYGWVVRVGLKQ